MGHAVASTLAEISSGPGDVEKTSPWPFRLLHQRSRATGSVVGVRRKNPLGRLLSLDKPISKEGLDDGTRQYQLVSRLLGRSDETNSRVDGIHITYEAPVALESRQLLQFASERSATGPLEGVVAGTADHDP